LVLTLGDVLFDTDRAELKRGAIRNLQRLVAFLGEHPERAVLIEGHTDSTGSATYNLDLAGRRARAVRTFLLEGGIARKRVIAEGYGESYPVASNASSGGRQQNRRVEVVILEPGEDVAVAARKPVSAPPPEMRE
jgi:outer membrane protein OmpA-like peptidoglycan-associated protein